MKYNCYLKKPAPSGFRREEDILLNWGFLFFRGTTFPPIHTSAKDFLWERGHVAGQSCLLSVLCLRSAKATLAGSQSRLGTAPAGSRGRAAIPLRFCRCPGQPVGPPGNWSRTLPQEQPYARWSTELPPALPHKKGNNYVLLNNHKFSQRCSVS